jgi:diguanylate cyclase (GGDEF)-like protein/PAS domain S-box-containing protein
MKTKFPISLSITIMISFHLIIIFSNWFILKNYNDSIKNDTKIINTLGQIRGGSQKYFKSYFYNNSTDNQNYINQKFILLDKLSKDKFEQQHTKIEELKKLWQDIEQNIANCNSKQCKENIFQLSEQFWIKSDKLVKELEISNEDKNTLIKVIFVILFLELVFVSFMIIIVYKLINTTLESQKNKMETYINMVDRYIITSSTDLRGNITYVSDAFCNISGYTKEELIGKNHRISRHEDMPKTTYEVLWSTIKDGKTWNGELKNRTKDGGYYWVDTHISPIYENNKHIGYTAVREDITNKKQMEELSITDPLTGLYNRRKFHEVTVSELNRVKRDIENNKNSHQLFFILLDIDHFKQYNDNYGHDKGDIVLKEVANILQLSLRRSTDFAFRIGGEEFGIVVVEDDILSVKMFAQKIRQNIEDAKIEHKYNSVSDYITASFGISISNKDFGYDLDTIYNRADKALYKAKHLGRNRVEMYKLTGEE